MSDESKIEWLTPKEAAARLKVHPETLYKLRSSGRGPQVHNIGPRSIRYRLSDLDAFVLNSSKEHS